METLFILALLAASPVTAAPGDQPAPVVIDLGLQQPYSRARALAARGEYAEAARLLQPMLSAPQNRLLLVDGRYVDAKVAANRLIGSFPPQARAFYERDYGGFAQRELQRAESQGRIDELLRIARTYRHTEAGRRSLVIVAGLLIDRGRFLEAASVAGELLESPGPALQEAATARLITAWLRLGESQRAREWIDQRRDLLASRDIEIRGAKRRLNQWLDEFVGASGLSAPAASPAAVGGHPQSVAIGAFRRPTSNATWTKRLGGSELRDAFLESVRRRTISGIAPVFHEVPLVIGQTALVRRHGELAAYDLMTGTSRWSHAFATAGESFNENGNAFQDESLMPYFVEMLVDRASAGGPSTAISSDGVRVFTVIDDETTRSTPVMGRRGRRFAVEPPPKNSLAAFDLKTGQRVWRLNRLPAELAESANEQTSRELDFLGPPFALGGTLYVLGRTAVGANVLALDPAQGAVRWSYSLAAFAGFDADPASSVGPACVPIQSDGLLICTLPEGIVMGFDLVSRTCRWAYRAQPTEEPPRIPPRWGRGMRGLQSRWLDGWRETAVRIDDGRCFFVSPRSAAIHCLKVDTGEIAWTRPVAGGLFLGPIVDGNVLAICNSQVACFKADNGSPLWSVPIGLPSGRGMLADGRYLLPQADGGLSAIDVRAGSIHYPGRHLPLLGNLLPLVSPSGTVSGLPAAISLSQDQLASLPPLDQVRADAAQALLRKPADREALLRLAVLDREGDDFESAERRLGPLLKPPAVSKTGPPNATAHGKKGAPELVAKSSVPQAPANLDAAIVLTEDEPHEESPPTARRQLVETLIADLEQNPARVDILAVRLSELPIDDPERAQALRTIAIARLRRGERMAALEGFLPLLALDLPPRLEMERGPKRVVAFERALRMDFADCMEHCSKADERQAEERLERFVATLLKRGDATQLRRMLARLSVVGWNHALRAKVTAALRPRPGFLRTQLDLWDSAHSSDRLRAAESWRTLAELYRSHDDVQDAAVSHRRLLDDYGDVQFPDGQRPADLIAAVKPDVLLARHIGGNVDPWPTDPPDVAADAQGGATTPFIALPLEIVPGSLCERLDVAIEREGQTLRFQGDSQSTYWDLSLPVENPSPPRAFLLNRGWSVGPLLIVQVGTNLYGVSPRDEEGGPVAKLLWTTDLLSYNRPKTSDLDLRWMPAALAPGGERVSLTDHLGRPVARVGPVLPGCICYYDRGTLAGLDLLSGRVQWRRTGVATCDLSAGDDSLIARLDRRSKRVELLRALDGKLIMDRAVDGMLSGLRWLEGRDAIIQVTDAQGTRVSRKDLSSGQSRWSGLFPAGSQIVRLDVRQYAAIQPDGTLSVFNAGSGTVLASSRVPGAEHCLQVHATQDEQSFYVACSSPFVDPENFRANSQRDDSRNPLVNGVLCALNRRTGKILWTRRFEDGVFAIDQSRVAPFLAFSYRHIGNGDEGAGVAWPVLHCIDKRTGRDVYFDRFSTVQSMFRPFTETDFGRREVLVRTADGAVRFRYRH